MLMKTWIIMKQKKPCIRILSELYTICNHLQLNLVGYGYDDYGSTYKKQLNTRYQNDHLNKSSIGSRANCISDYVRKFAKLIEIRTFFRYNNTYKKGRNIRQGKCYAKKVI